jgi:tetratricopeptide (TPR) repeat protein
MAAQQLSGVGSIIPLRGGSSREAVALRANHMVHGYFDRRKGALHFEFSIEDVATHQMRPLPVEGGVVEVSDSLAKAIDAGAKPFSSSNPAAIQAWAELKFARAVELDPDFGAAWRDLAQSQQANSRAIIAKALERSTLRTPLDRAQLDLVAARLDKDADRVEQAGKKLIALLPNDASFIRLLAQQESDTRRFAEAIQHFERAIKLEPEEATQYNGLGYAQFFAGDLLGARKSFDLYMRFPGQEGNALDSQGEVLFMAGQFKDAEQYFLKAHAQSPTLLNGGDLLKAAYSRWLSGDLPGADKIFESYIRVLSQTNDSLINWRRAAWEYSTGRKDLARARLKGASDSLAAHQLRVWETESSLPLDLPPLEQQYKQAPPAADGLIRTVYAKALKKAGKDAEVKQLTKLWPLPELGENVLLPFVFPWFLELKKGN